MLTMLSPNQRKVAESLFHKGYYFYRTFPYGGKNKPAWKLCELGLAEWGIGPKGSFLQTYCFMPVWTDPVC